MRKAVDLFETSEYWKQRAAGALAHAKYKERPDVRHRRIKGIESDRRKVQKNQDESRKMIAAWSIPTLNREKALHIANYSGYSSRSYPLDKFPRDLPASQYEGPMGVWSAIEGGVITWEQARDLERSPRTSARCRTSSDGSTTTTTACL